MLDFYPRSPRGERLRFQPISAFNPAFLSTLPARGATYGRKCYIKVFGFLSTLPARGATDAFGFSRFWLIISIHAPREGSDGWLLSGLHCGRDISIHAPREGSDRCQSSKHSSATNFYPRSPRGERPIISSVLTDSCGFLSTLPARGATYNIMASQREKFISIHAPREGSDIYHELTEIAALHFYPRSPRGERQGRTSATRRCIYFYPRSPRGERRTANRPNTLWQKISIHAPREGSDLFRVVCTSSVTDFYPRSPRGERLVDVCGNAVLENFYPRSPRGERPNTASSPKPRRPFLSTLPARGATASRWSFSSGCRHFYPRSPRGERQQMC